MKGWIRAPKILSLCRISFLVEANYSSLILLLPPHHMPMSQRAFIIPKHIFKSFGSVVKEERMLISYEYNFMKFLLSVILVAFASVLINCSSNPFWDSIPSMRAGQIDSVTNLMTAEDTSTNITDTVFTYYTPILGGVDITQLRYGLSLISYESWMTDTFSFNITMVTCTFTGATIRFTVLDNTFFTQAKVHYLVIWPQSTDNSNSSTAYYNMEVIYGCYLTDQLLASPTNINRNQTVGGLQQSAIVNSQTVPVSALVVKSMISGMQLSNSVGNNDYIKVTPFFPASSSYISYKVQVQSNNLLTFFCISTVIANPSQNTKTYLYNLEYGTYTLTATNTGLTTVPYALRYDGSDRMFFGISEFNLSMSDTRYLNVETANISLVSLLYATNAAMNKVTYNAFYFARRACTAPAYYDPVNYTCVDNSSLCVDSHADGSPGYVCNPCHYSCLTCNVGSDLNGCATCPSTTSTYRQAAGSRCPCKTGYADAGSQVCQTCNVTLIGCTQCSSTSVCTACDTTTYTLNGTTCYCNSPLYMASGYCLTYPGCLVAGYYNNIIACQTCDTANNFIAILSNFTCACNTGFFYSNTTRACYDVCGDNITAYGRCDDGNNVTGDGCDSNCNIENGYYCSYNFSATGVPGISVCVLKQDLTVSYLYAERFIDTNSFKMAFQITPIQSGLTTTSFDKNFNTSLPISSQKISCDPTTNIIYLQGTYLQDLQGTSQTASISFNNMSFYADSQSITFNAEGINAQLVMDQYASSNLILSYIVMAEALIALFVAIFASVVGLKLAGIELLIPLQLIYFTLSTLSQQRSYNFALNDLKYANGYNQLITYSYARTYSQSKSLVGMNYETEFLLSTNIMLVIFVFVLFWLLIHHFRLKYKQYKLETFLEANSLNQPVPEKENSVDSEEDKEDVEQDEERIKLKKKKKNTHNTELQKEESRLREDHHRSFKVFSFQVDRIYFIFYLILINQMMFGFIIMTLNVPISTFYFPEEINVLVCNFIFFIFIGNIVFISYDQESNKMIAFTCIKDRYAYIYLLIDFIIITALSMSFQQSFSGYLITALTLSFPILVIKQRPYSSVFLTLQNIISLYLQIMLVVCEIIVCLIDTSSDQKTSLIYSFLIMGLIAVGEILTIVRIAVKVNFKKAFDDLKNPHKDDQNDKKSRKIVQKNLDLLEEDKNVSIIPPESVKNDLFPKSKMVDWQSKNTEEYESIRQRDMDEGEAGENQVENEDEASENKEEKLNELEILKKRLRNNLKLKKEQDMQKKGI